MLLLKMSAQTDVVSVDSAPDWAKMPLTAPASGVLMVLPLILSCIAALPLESLPRMPVPANCETVLLETVAANVPVPPEFRSMPLQPATVQPEDATPALPMMLFFTVPDTTPAPAVVTAMTVLPMPVKVLPLTSYVAFDEFAAAITT